MKPSMMFTKALVPDAWKPHTPLMLHGPRYSGSLPDGDAPMLMNAVPKNVVATCPCVLINLNVGCCKHTAPPKHCATGVTKFSRYWFCPPTGVMTHARSARRRSGNSRHADSRPGRPSRRRFETAISVLTQQQQHVDAHGHELVMIRLLRCCCCCFIPLPRGSSAHRIHTRRIQGATSRARWR